MAKAGAQQLTGSTTTIPNYTKYGQAGLLAKTAYENALARLNRQRQDTLQEYGYSGDIDKATGVPTNLRVNPNDPYGLYQGMLGSHATQYEQAQGAAQERGLGGRGGLASQALTMLRHNFGGEAAQLGTGLTKTLADYMEQQQGAAFERDKMLYEAELEAARQAIADGAYPTAPPPGGGDDGTSDGTSTGGGETEDERAAREANEAFQRWLAGQAAAAGQFRTNSPRGTRGTYVE